VGIPVAQITAIFGLPLSFGASRVVKGVRIEHVCGNPGLSPEKDAALGLQIVRVALRAVQTEVSSPTLFDPAKEMTMEGAVQHDAS
jgi:glycine/betaine/sarcosine/D-proline reductase family selenoprotein B